MFVQSAYRPATPNLKFSAQSLADRVADEIRVARTVIANEHNGSSAEDVAAAREILESNTRWLEQQAQ